jgi:hypothetical protein
MSPKILKYLPWIGDWSRDTIVKEFLQKRHLLEYDPFVTEEGYPELRDAVKACIAGSSDALKGYISKLGSIPRTKAVAVMAVFTEVTLLYTLSQKTPAHVPTIAKIFAEANLFSDTEMEFVKTLLYNNSTCHPEIFQISSTSNLEQVLLLSSIVRIVSLGFLEQQSLLRSLLFSPLSLGMSPIMFSSFCFFFFCPSNFRSRKQLLADHAN